MEYDAIHQDDRDEQFDDYHSTSSSPDPHLASPSPAPLSLLSGTRNHENASGTGTFGELLNSITSRTTRSSTSYDMVEPDDYGDPKDSPAPSLSLSKHSAGSPTQAFVTLNIARPDPRRPQSNSVAAATATAAEETTNFTTPRSIPPKPILRSASGRNVALRHPIPDLQVLQGAYTGNIELLERTAERLSMTSSIDDAIRELHLEQKRIDSRRSSLLSSPEMESVTRQMSNASSIVETNNLARSGGYSPAGFMMSPKGSFSTSGRGRSASKSSRFGSRPEPELEGRPLDSFVNSSAMSPRSASIAEQEEDTTTLTKPVVDLLDSNLDLDLRMPERTDGQEKERPTTSASTNTFDQAEKAFADFDGEYVPQQRSASGKESNIGLNSNRRISSGDPLSVDNLQTRASSGDFLSAAGSDSNNSRRVSSGGRTSMARPQSYADPQTGQQMVYYPAPVPMMLNLPQKLSKMPSSMARNQRRSQVLSSLPPVARQSAIWLPDVLEIEDEPDLAEDDGAQQMEYVAQHQRSTMGGRRLAQDVQHLPPQLRASAFFDVPGPNQTVQLKDQSAVATLDSILDASAYAPVSAFTDHEFAGHLGSEVYGKSNMRNSRSSTNLLADEKSKKRTSSFNILRGRRASSSELLESEEEKRRNTIADIRNGKILREDDEDDDAEARALRGYEEASGDEAADGEEEEYCGAPTTLLAELQIRKQQQKHRTRPLVSAYPNGMHSTLLEHDAVAQVEKNTRKQKRVNLAWEDPAVVEAEDPMTDDEDVPLALLYAKKSRVQEPNRPMGLMERREMEDNEPLSRRRDRLLGRPPATNMNRASTMVNLQSGVSHDEEGETLAQRVRRLKDQETNGTALPPTRAVSGDFASEMMSEFGGDLSDPKGKGKEPLSATAPEEEETLGQRRKRLQAEKEARAKEVGESLQRPALQQRRSMADLLAAHPAASSNRVPSYSRPPSGLLGMFEHEKATAQKRSSSMLNLDQSRLPGHQANVGGLRAGMYNDGQGGIIPSQKPQPQRIPSGYNMYNAGAFQQFPQPSLGYGHNGFGVNNQMMMPFTNPYMMGANGMGMQMSYTMPHLAMGMMGVGTEPLNQGQIDMVERWRQSVMQ